MSEEEKRIYNQRRTEAFRRRRMEEEMLLAMPIGRINGEALDRAQQIVVRNAKRAEAARLRYQRMTPDQRKSYNQKRYTPKRRRMEGMDSMLSSSGGSLAGSCKKEEDALTAIERDVLKKTQQAQQAIMRQQRQAVQVISQPVATTPTPQGVQGGTYIIQQGSSTPVTHIGQGQVQQIQLASSNGVTHQQVVHTVHQVPVQTIQGQQGPHVTVGQQQMPSSSGHLVVQQHVPTTSGGQQLVHQQTSAPQQITYTTGGMMTTTYYTPAPTTFHGNSNSLFSQDRKGEYLLVSSNIMSSSTSAELSAHSSLESRLPELSSSIATTENGLLSSTVTLTKEHPAVAQADQMNAFIDTYFVEHEPSTSSQTVDNSDHEHDDYDSMDGSIGQEIDNKKKKQRELERRERDRRELENLLRDSNEDIDLQKYREQRSKMRRAEAARSRYQRMSEAERKIYNQRRRLRALGLDPDTPKGQFIDNEAIREHIKMANAKKAEAARLRYHRMTAEERREYNQRRTESFRKRRVEEEILLSTPAGRISAEALQKAQQIMIRNARKAEAARARYQKMTPEQRKEYNMRRAQAKKLRAMGRGGNMSSDCSVDGSITDSSGLSSSFQHNSAVSLLDSADLSSSHEHLNSSNPQVAQTTDDIFEQMEREVIKRTKQAHMALARQQQQSQTSRFGSVEQQLIEGDQVLITNDGHLVDDKVYVQPSQLIDEKALHEMLITGLDANGQPVELRTVDGTLIRGEEQLRAITNGQPFLIHPQPMPLSSVDEQGKQLTFANSQDQIELVPSSSSMVLESSHALYASHEIVIDDIDTLYALYKPSNPQPESLRSNLSAPVTIGGNDNTRGLTVLRNETKLAKRNVQNERAYGTTVCDRKYGNNRTPNALSCCGRLARQRDEELCHLAETCQLDTLDEETRRAIAEAQMRRARRAEQARAKYHRMNSEERRQYNAMRDAQRRQRKRAQEEARQRAQLNEVLSTETGLSPHSLSPSVNESISPNDHGLSPGGAEPGQIIYSTYEMYQEPMTQWEQ
ncbi:hypothetical protein COOONC_15022 [Cooperia oncophora]